MTTVVFDAAFVERISSARPAEMTAMLLEESVRALEECIEAIENNEIERRFMSSARAMKIVGFLHETLNFEEGGDVAINLDRIYRLAIARIARVNPFNEIESAVAAIRVLKPQAEAWRDVDAEETHEDMPDIATVPGLGQRPAPMPAYAS